MDLIEEQASTSGKLCSKGTRRAAEFQALQQRCKEAMSANCAIHTFAERGALQRLCREVISLSCNIHTSAKLQALQALCREAPSPSCTRYAANHCQIIKWQYRYAVTRPRVT